MRHRARAGTLLAFVIVLFILACGGITPTPAVVPAVTPAVATAIPPRKTPAPTPIPIPAAILVRVPGGRPTPVVARLPNGLAGGSLTVAASAGFPHRGVHQSVQESLISLGPGIAYSRLLRLKTAPGLEQPNLMVECDLCESWTLTEELVYEFKLRPQVHWQNIPPVNGRQLVAQDLAFSYRRLGTPGWPNATLLSPFALIEAAGPGVLRMGLALPDPDALLSLADGHAKVVASEVVEEFGGLKDGPVIGTGPWIWDETGADDETRFQRNADYFEAGLPFLDELVIKVVRDPQGARFPGEGRLAAFLAGQVDVVDLPPRAWQSLEDSGVGFESAMSLKGGSGVMLWFNAQDPFFSDASLRQAVFRAIDPWDYVDTLWLGQGYAGVGIPVSEADGLLGKDEVRGSYFADPSMARDLLAAGLLNRPENGGSGRIELTVWSEPRGQIYTDLGARIAQDLEAVGFNVNVRRFNPDQFFQMMMGAERDYQVVLGLLPPTTTANSFLLALLHSGGRWNIANHDDAELDAMIGAQAVDLDAVSRKERLEEIQRYILDQAYLFSPVTGATRWAFPPGLKGFHPNAALSEYIHWSRVWFEP